MTEPESLDPLFSALADRSRRAILAKLLEGPASVSALVEATALSQPAVSKHVKVLEQAGLVARSRDAQWRPCQLEGARLRELHEWAGRFRAAWEKPVKKAAVKR